MSGQADAGLRQGWQLAQASDSGLAAPWLDLRGWTGA
jgi:hypothetical protein